MKYLFLNCCSWVEGDELKDRKHSRFSKLVSTNLGLEDINWGLSGCSNERIIISTMNWIDLNSDKLSDTIMLIGFTATSRSKYDWEMKDIRMFQSHLELMGIEHHLFFSFSQTHQHLSKGKFKNFTDKSFYEVVMGKNKDETNLFSMFAKNGHPNEDSHETFAKYLTGWISERK